MVPKVTNLGLHTDMPIETEDIQRSMRSYFKHLELWARGGSLERGRTSVSPVLLRTRKHFVVVLLVVFLKVTHGEHKEERKLLYQ